MAKTTSKSKSKQALKNRTRLEWVLFALLLLIAYLLLASRYEWWPWSTQNDNLGTAFYVVKQNSNKDAAGLNTNGSGAASSTGSGGANSGNNGNNGSNGSNGSNGGNNNGGGTNNPPSSSNSPLLTFAAGVDTGNTKQETSGQAGGLNENCAVVANASSLGKQEVCTYTEGDKLITITYLNDRVISASRSGF